MKTALTTLVYLFIALCACRTEAKEPLTVLTAYHEDVVSRFETAFEREHPDIDLRILWRMPHDALPYLQQVEHGGVDVYWSAALNNFLTLKQQGAWQKLDIDRSDLPEKLGAMPLLDPDGYFCATEMAGYGLAVNPAYLQQHGLPVPKTWQELGDARYRGHLALPVPSKVGFAPMLIDAILQQYGWRQGWEVLSAIAANSKMVESGSTFISDILGSGERGIGLTIDFFTASAIANGAPLEFVYPEPVAYSPAQIGITSASRHKAASKRFVDFVLSETGQKMLFHPDIRKLPVRPSVYQDKPVGYFDPFAASAQHPVIYNPNQAMPRLALQNAVFDSMFSERLDRLKSLRQKLSGLEQKGGTDIGQLEKIRSLLSAAPITEAQAGNPDWQRLFLQRKRNAQADADAKRLEQDWNQILERRYREAEKRIAELQS